jgi:hypothetical protein
VADSTVSRTQPSRQAALRARKHFCGQLGRDATAKRRKRVEIGSTETETVSTLTSQVANAAALATTREVVNNADRITEMLTQIQGGAGSLVSRPMVRRPLDELSLFIDLTERASINSTEAWAHTVLRRIDAAHFDRLYTAAVADAGRGQNSSFFRLSDERLRQHGQVPVRKSHPGYRAPSAVRDRLIELLWLDPERRPRISKAQCRQRIHRTQQDGKRWRRLIESLGYKILYCLPPEITDNQCVSPTCCSLTV